MGRVYAVVSAKGGVGKTTTTTNLAAALAASGASVAVVDGDLGMANLAGSLGVDSSGATLHDVLAGEAELTDAARPGPHGMTVVPGSPDLDAFARADPEGLEGVLEELADDHDYVLLDTGAGLSNDTVVPLTFVDEILLVSTTGRDALGDTEKTRAVADRLDVPVAGVVATRVDTDDPRTAVVEETLETTVLASIPRADVVRNAGDAGEPLTTYAPGSAAASAYRALASGLTGESLPDAESAVEAVSEADDGPAAEPAADADRTAEAEPSADADPATESDPAEAGDTAVEAETAVETDPDAEEDIIVAGDHEADGEPVGDEAAADAPAADPLADPEPPEDDPEAPESGAPSEAPADDEPLIRNEGVAERSVPDPDADDATPTDDEPLIATAEPTADVAETDDEETSDADDAPDGSADTADGVDDTVADEDGEDRDDTADDGEGDDGDEDDTADDGESDDGDEDDTADDGEGDEDDEEDGVYTTSLADEASQSEKKEEKKGLFGRFLG